MEKGRHNPIIAGIRSSEEIGRVNALELDMVFILSGSISELAGDVARLKDSGKKVFLHVDLVNGLRPDKEGLRFVKEVVRPHGIISTKVMTIRQAKALGLKTVFRIFMVDAVAYSTGLNGIKACDPDYIEVMPGLVVDVIRQLKASVRVPIIAGGMIKTMEQVRSALQNGAYAISTSNQALWKKNW